jgi:hypothetical protein
VEDDVIIAEKIHTKSMLAAGEPMEDILGGILSGADDCHGRQNVIDKISPISYFIYRE